MGLLSKLFGRSLTRDRWYIKVDLLTELSEIARKHWIREWTAAVQGTYPGEQDSSPAAEFRLPEAGGQALRTFQASLTVGFIERYRYVPPADQQDFAGYLLGSLVGEYTPEAAALLDRYKQPDHGYEQSLDHFAQDLGAAIASTGIPDTSGRIRATLPQFATEQEYITALCFGDMPRAKVLKAKIEAAFHDPLLP